MPRNINLVLQKLKNKEYNMPIELYQIYLSEETLYLACYPKNIQFFDENGNPQAYTAAALSRNPVNTNIDTKVDTTQVTIGNVNQEMSAYIAHTEFVGKRLVVWKVFLEDLSDPNNYVCMFDGIMDAPRINEKAMSVTVVSKLDTLDKKLPGRTYQVQCSWQFGDQETCGKIVPKRIGKVTSINNGEYQKIGFSEGSNDAVNYWKHGEIIIGRESRIVTQSGKGYVMVEYPFYGVQINDTYTVKAGCDKSMDGPHGCKHWGNEQYYGGFLSIPGIRDVREVG